MEMNTKDVHTKLALALLSLWIFLANAIVTGQYSSYLPESSYSSSSSSSGSSHYTDYGNENENQKNYYDNPNESNSGDEYSTDPYRSQQFHYEGGGDFDEQEDSYNQSPDYQPQTNYHQDYLSEEIYPFRQNQVQDSYGRPYSSHHHHQYADLGQDSSASSLASFDNIGLNRSESMNHQAAAPDEVKYPPIDTETHHLNHQHHHSHHRHHSPTKQQHLRAAHYTPTNNYMSSSMPSSRLNGYSPYMADDDDEKLPPTSKDNTAYSNMDTLMMLLNKSISASTPPLALALPKTLQQAAAASSNQQKSVMTYLQSEEPEQDQHHHQYSNVGRESQLDPHFESPSVGNITSSSLSQTFHVADDSDLLSSSSYHQAAPAPQSQLHFDAHTLSLLQKYLVQHPHVVSSPQQLLPAPYPIGNPVPISKHVEITKHVPVPVYRQVHVPFRKNVRIEIPRPVISTIPRPYPIKIPTVTKTIAVPLVREVKIPIDKVVPYPVENRVPYIVQKRVPFEVEKQIAVPKYYPFPVKVPMVRTIMHKKKHQPLLLHQHHRPSLLDYYPKRLI